MTNALSMLLSIGLIASGAAVIHISLKQHRQRQSAHAPKRPSFESRQFKERPLDLA